MGANAVKRHTFLQLFVGVVDPVVARLRSCDRRLGESQHCSSNHNAARMGTDFRNLFQLLLYRRTPDRLLTV